MTEYVYLGGSEDVARAGYSMREAAVAMNHAANTIDGALRHHQQFLEDWLQRFEQIITTLKEKT